MTEAQKQAAEAAKKAAEVAAEAAKKQSQQQQPQQQQPQQQEEPEMTEAEKKAAEAAKKAAEIAAEAAKKKTNTNTAAAPAAPAQNVFDVPTRSGTGTVSFVGKAGHTPGQVNAMVVNGGPFDYTPAGVPSGSPVNPATVSPSVSLSTTVETVKIGADTSVTLNGNPASMADIQVGDTVNILKDANVNKGISISISR